MPTRSPRGRCLRAGSMGEKCQRAFWIFFSRCAGRPFVRQRADSCQERATLPLATTSLQGPGGA
eukprot:scaffold20450_cov56-Phaeocystis_antarctica.AAC.2